MHNWSLEKENLEKLINDGVSYEEIGRKYGCSGACIVKNARKIGIKLQPRRTINKKETFNKGKILKGLSTCLNCGKQFVRHYHSEHTYCSNKCQMEFRHKINYQKIIDGDESIMRANYSLKHYKQDIINEQDGLCAICNMPQEWNGKELIFILDHIDGNAANNKRNNLRCICPNCDSQLSTYKRKNKNSARHYYRYHKNKI